jgi:putative transposase
MTAMFLNVSPNANWGTKQGIAIQHIQPGQPQQNAYAERYNRTVRHKWLANTYRKNRVSSRSGHAMAMELQQRPPQHGHRRHNIRHETENSRMNSTDAPR